MTQTINIPKNLFCSEAEYQAFAAGWKKLARAKKLTPQDCLLRCLLLKQDIDSVLPVTKDAIRLANGGAEASGRQRAVKALRNTHPVNDYQRRSQRAAELRARNRPVPEYLFEPGWAEGWVDVLDPDSLEKGLTVGRFLEASELSRGVTA